MAKKNKTDPTDLAETLIANLDEDREKLTNFFDKLLASEDVTLYAEAVAKIADSLTKQNSLRAAAVKNLGRPKPQDGRDDFDDFGRPFDEEQEEGN